MLVRQSNACSVSIRKSHLETCQGGVACLWDLLSQIFSITSQGVQVNMPVRQAARLAFSLAHVNRHWRQGAAWR